MSVSCNLISEVTSDPPWGAVQNKSPVQPTCKGRGLHRGVSTRDRDRWNRREAWIEAAYHSDSGREQAQSEKGPEGSKEPEKERVDIRNYLENV